MDTNPSISSLNIAAINVNSLIANHRRYELFHFAKTHNLDVILLSETKLSNKYNLSFKDYKLIRTDRKNLIQGGGTAILI